ncbi:MAG: hypothetical protein AAB299_05535 [Thermodesulfobacteriota bacterium]
MGRPIITYAMDHLRQAGIERFIVNTHHCAEVYQQVFPGHAWRGVPILSAMSRTSLIPGED